MDTKGFFRTTPLSDNAPEIEARAEEYRDVEVIYGNAQGEKRVPVVLILDTSGSMGRNRKIDELNDGVRCMMNKFKNEPSIGDRIDISIITMGGEKPQATGLESVYLYEDKEYMANGYTLMGDSLNLAMNEIKVRKQFYLEHGITYCRPWVILMSDGMPSDDMGYAITDESILASYAQFVRKNTEEKHAVFYTFYIGNDLKAEQIMRSLASEIETKKNGIKKCAYAMEEVEGSIEALFDFLSNSIKLVVGIADDVEDSSDMHMEIMKFQ